MKMYENKINESFEFEALDIWICRSKFILEDPIDLNEADP